MHIGFITFATPEDAKKAEALFNVFNRVAECARATLNEQRREFARGEISDLDDLEGALNALDEAMRGP